MPSAAWVALSLIRHVGAKTMRALVADFNGDLEAVLMADEARLRRVPGIGIKTASAIRALQLPEIEQAAAQWRAQGVQIVGLQEDAYPPQLRALDDAPATLFVLSHAPFHRALIPPARTIAIIGTRTPTAHARAQTLRLASELAESGQVVVSGLAHGIDSAAHQGALALPQGRTLAVLGSGVMKVYPPENHPLAKAIQARGALVCEVQPFATVSPSGLVARNRIITGLAHAVIVVETADDGGAMHAARFARAQGRAVYVVDNPASGNRALIAQGGRVIPPDWVNHDWRGE